jgi:hypothetical protein
VTSSKKGCSGLTGIQKLECNQRSSRTQVARLKTALQKENKTLIAYAEETPIKKKNLLQKAEAELKEKIAKLEVQSVKELAQHLKAQVSIYFNHQTFLATTTSLSLFRDCLSSTTYYTQANAPITIKNNPAVAHDTKEQRYVIIKQMVTSEESAASDDKETKVVINAAAQDKQQASNGKKENEVEMQTDCSCAASIQQVVSFIQILPNEMFGLASTQLISLIP